MRDAPFSFGPRVMREREALGENGFVTVVGRYDRSNGRLVGQSRILSGGFVYTPESGDLLDRAQDMIRSAGSVKAGTSAKQVEAKVERALATHFCPETRRNPVLKAAVMEG